MRSPHDIVRKPLITEKSMTDVSEGKYTFVVDKKANKTEIKNALEKIFDVKVAKVNTMNMKGKVKRVGVHVGKKASWKKAIVTLAEGSKGIEFFEGM